MLKLQIVISHKGARNIGTVYLSEVNRTIEHLLRCGVSRNDAERIAYAAAKYLVLRLKPRTDFDLSGIPTPDELFPPRETDSFYDLLLQYKEKAAKSPLYKNLDEKDCFKKAIDSIIEYEF